MSLPAATSTPTAPQLSAGGTPYYSELVMVAADTGLPWQGTIAGDPVAWAWAAIPSCADIADDFASCTALAAAVPSCTALLSWGF